MAEATSGRSAEGTANPLTGIVLMLAAMAFLPVVDAAAKLLATHMPTVEIVWARYFFHALVVLPFAIGRYGARLLRPARPWLQVFRALALMASTGLYFAALRTMPLADTLATAFVAPFFVTALSPWLLGERVGAWRWSAVIVGFLGAMVVIRPGFATLNEGVPLALTSALTFSLYVLATRKLAGSNPPLVTIAWTGMVGAVVAGAAMPFVWIAPSAQDWMLMAVVGLTAAAGHMLITMAYEHAHASVLSPLGYSEIVGATLLGILIFGDFPDRMTWLGIAIIIASGVVIAWREGLRRGR